MKMRQHRKVKHRQFMHPTYKAARWARAMRMSLHRLGLFRSPWWRTPHDDDEFPPLAVERREKFLGFYMTLSEQRSVAKQRKIAEMRPLRSMHEPISDAEFSRVMLGAPYDVIRPNLPTDPLKE